jgi:hypothetical protein
MKKLTMAALALSLVAMSSLAFAQAEPYDVGVFADAAGTTSDVLAAPFVPFNFYVVGFDLDGGILGYEFGLTLDPGFTVFTAGLTGPNPLNLGTTTNVIVGTGGCVASVTGGVVLTAYNGGYVTGSPPVADTAFCISGTTPSSFADVPGYLQCDSNLVPFGVAQNGGGVYPNACMIVNPTMPGTVVAIENASFGDLKARF